MNVLLIALLFSWAPINPPASTTCEGLAAMQWGGFKIHAAVKRRAEGKQPAHCFVQGTIDTEINFEVWLPERDTWNGRFIMGGGGGFVGKVENQAFNLSPDLLARGFATAGTDTGHQGPGTRAGWALNRIDREINFGHRAIHLTTQAAKTITRIYYDRDIAFAYFMGCSRGGGQAMMASQRYPDDFDGIVAGAPAFNWRAIGAQFVQNSRAMYPDPAMLSTPAVRFETRELLESSILAACDGLDGLTDGMLNDPRRCSFDLDELPLCENDLPAKGCLTTAEYTAITTIYRGPVVNGEVVHPGFPFGGETHPGVWGAWIVGQENGVGPGHPSLQFAFGTELFKYIFFDDPDWNYAAYDFDNWEKDTRAGGTILDATDPDLTHFNVAGGKIIYWTGWTDAALTALGIIDYFEEVQKQNMNATDFSRLFLMPGVHHCGGGPGPDAVDWLTAIQAWVEENRAPDTLLATRRQQGKVVMQRPLCAYPARAVFLGNGDGTEPDQFRCETP